MHYRIEEANNSSDRVCYRTRLEARDYQGRLLYREFNDIQLIPNEKRVIETGYARNGDILNSVNRNRAPTNMYYAAMKLPKPVVEASIKIC